jgi:ribosomal protein L32
MNEYPSITEQAKNLVNFAAQVATNNGPLFVTDEVKAQRLTICKSCEHYDASQIRCKSCGCFLLQKASFALDSCPLRKWNSMTQETKQDEVIESENSLQPNFPNPTELGQVYIWNQVSWTWNGNMWNLNTETLPESK